MSFQLHYRVLGQSRSTPKQTLAAALLKDDECGPAALTLTRVKPPAF